MSKRIENAIQVFAESLPKNSEIYIFGSFLTKVNPSDLDILIIYDEEVCIPEKAYERIEPSVRKLEKIIGFSVDLTLLTKEEENSVGFVIRENCQKLDKVAHLLKNVSIC